MHHLGATSEGRHGGGRRPVIAINEVNESEDIANTSVSETEQATATRNFEIQSVPAIAEKVARAEEKKREQADTMMKVCKKQISLPTIFIYFLSFHLLSLFSIVFFFSYIFPHFLLNSAQNQTATTSSITAKWFNRWSSRRR